MMIRSSIRALILLLGVGVLLAGCVAKSTFEAKEQEAAKAMSELDAARAAGRAVSAELDTVKAERDGLQRDLETTRAMLQAANRRLGELEQSIAQHEAEINRLQKITTEKEQEIARLRNTYDSLVRDLKKEIEAGEIKVTQFRDLLTVNLVEKILFDSGRAEIKPRGLEILQRVGDILKGVQDKVIRIEGHTDNVPIGVALRTRFPTNWELSTSRATVVARFLQDKVGLDPNRLSATGYGPYRPVAPNDNDEGRAQNRRIEIILAPLPPETAAGG